MLSLLPLTRHSPPEQIYQQLHSYQALLDQSKRFKRRGSTCHDLQTAIGVYVHRSNGLYTNREEAWEPYGRARGFLPPLRPLPLPLPLPPSSPSLSLAVSPSFTSTSSAISTSFADPATSPASSSSSSSSATAPLVLPTALLPSSQPRMTYDPLLLQPAPELFRSVVGPIPAVRIQSDGQCWLRTIAVGVDPAQRDTEERLSQVRGELRQEHSRWGAEMWMERVPGYGLRELVYDSDRSHSSYDSYLSYLSDPSHRYRWLDHCVFYLASSRYDVGFLILAQLNWSPTASATDSLYHRFIRLSPISTRTVYVLHHAGHYHLLDVNLSDDSHKAAVATICSLPTMVKRGRWTDVDFQQWSKAKKAAESPSRRAKRAREEHAGAAWSRAHSAGSRQR